MVEHKIDMNNRKDYEEPHHHMVPLTNREIAAHQWNDPREHVGQPRITHRGIHSESGYALKQENKERYKISKAR